MMGDQDYHKRKRFSGGKKKKRLIIPRECVKNKCLLEYQREEEHANILALSTN